jgi:hypothetical protein
MALRNEHQLSFVAIALSVVFICLISLILQTLRGGGNLLIYNGL